MQNRIVRADKLCPFNLLRSQFWLATIFPATNCSCLFSPKTIILEWMLRASSMSCSILEAFSCDRSAPKLRRNLPSRLTPVITQKLLAWNSEGNAIKTNRHSAGANLPTRWFAIGSWSKRKSNWMSSIRWVVAVHPPLYVISFEFCTLCPV